MLYQTSWCEYGNLNAICRLFGHYRCTILSNQSHGLRMCKLLVKTAIASFRVEMIVHIVSVFQGHYTKRILHNSQAEVGQSSAGHVSLQKRPPVPPFAPQPEEEPSFHGSHREASHTARDLATTSASNESATSPNIIQFKMFGLEAFYYVG